MSQIDKLNIGEVLSKFIPSLIVSNSKEIKAFYPGTKINYYPQEEDKFFTSQAISKLEIREFNLDDNTKKKIEQDLKKIIPSIPLKGLSTKDNSNNIIDALIKNFLPKLL